MTAWVNSTHCKNCICAILVTWYRIFLVVLSFFDTIRYLELGGRPPGDILTLILRRPFSRSGPVPVVFRCISTTGSAFFPCGDSRFIARQKFFIYRLLSRGRYVRWMILRPNFGDGHVFFFFLLTRSTYALVTFSRQRNHHRQVHQAATCKPLVQSSPRR